jgi:general secretion pathway protein L
MEGGMMHGNMTGIEIGTDHIAAVQTGTGLKGRRIRACIRIPLQAGGMEEGLDILAATLDLKHDVCRVTIPEEMVSFRNVPMPFTDARKVRQALPFEVESMLPYPVEDLLIDFVTTTGVSGGGVLAASVRKTDLSGYLGLLQSKGIDPDVVEVRGAPLASWLLSQPGVPDNFLVLDVEEARHTLVLCLQREIALIRSAVAVVSDRDIPVSLAPGSGESMDPFFMSLGAAVHRTVHAFTAGAGIEERPERLFFTGERVQAPLCADILNRLLGMPAEPIDVSRDKRLRIEGDMVGEWSGALMSGALSLALRNGRGDAGFNLRRDEFGLERRYAGIRKALPRAAVFLFLILSFVAADIIVDTYLLKRAYNALDREIVSIFRQTLPQVTRIIDPVQQLRVAVAELRQPSLSLSGATPESSILDLLQEISRRIPASVRVQVHRMVVDPETIRISGKTDTFNEVDRIKNGLSTSKRFGPVSITSANLDRTGSRVQFEITIERLRDSRI